MIVDSLVQGFRRAYQGSDDSVCRGVLEWKCVCEGVMTACVGVCWNESVLRVWWQRVSGCAGMKVCWGCDDSVCWGVLEWKCVEGGMTAHVPSVFPAHWVRMHRWWNQRWQLVFDVVIVTFQFALIVLLIDTNQCLVALQRVTASTTQSHTHTHTHRHHIHHMTDRETETHRQTDFTTDYTHRCKTSQLLVSV